MTEEWIEKLAIQELCARYCHTIDKILGDAGYEDQLVKRNGRWLIAHRKCQTDRLVANPEKAVNLADPDVAALVRHLVEAARRLAKPAAG